MKISQRAHNITPFYVMEVGKAAAELGAQVADSDQPMVFLNIGEPDFTAPPLVQEAADRAIHKGLSQYTPALGLTALRERISHWYSQRYALADGREAMRQIEDRLTFGKVIVEPNP